MSGTGRIFFEKYGFVINASVKLIKVIPKSLRQKLLHGVRRWKGYKGIFLRFILLKSIAKECGNNVVIMEDVYLYHPENMIFGSNVSIHPMCYIQASTSGIKFGNDVSIAHGTTVIAESHTYADTEIPIKYQEMISNQIVIENNVWIGAKCTILNGIHVHEGVVIGANSVVTHDIKSNVVAVGIPCREIKKRGILYEKNGCYNTNL